MFEEIRQRKKSFYKMEALRANVLQVSPVNDEILRNLVKYQVIPAPEGFAHVDVQLMDHYRPRDKTIDDLIVEIPPVVQQISEMEKFLFLYNKFSMPVLSQCDLSWQTKEIIDTLNVVAEKHLMTLYKLWHALKDDEFSKRKRAFKRRDKRQRYKKNKRNNKRDIEE